MNASLLRQLSDERAALLTSLSVHAWAVGASGPHTVSAIHWRGPYLISAAERLAGMERVRLYPAAGADAAELEGEIVATDLSTDVAVIRAASELSATARAAAAVSGESLRLGASVAVVGCDRHGVLGVFGNVSQAGSAWRSRRGGQIDQRLELAVAVDGRFEGALLGSTEGQLAAMLVLGPRGRPLGIPAATIERVLGSVEQHGYLPRPYLGLRLQPLWLDPPTSQRFGRRSTRVPVVAGIDADSPAAAAGVQPGDLLSSIDERELEGVDALRRVLAGTRVGQTLRLSVLRGGSAQTLTLTVAERPRSQVGRAP
jgi:S1-C subfamily serine protease